MKIRIEKITKHELAPITNSDKKEGQWWEVEYKIEENKYAYYLIGKTTFENKLPSEEDIINTITKHLIWTIKELL